jgi:hypothetical protein
MTATTPRVARRRPAIISPRAALLPKHPTRTRTLLEAHEALDDAVAARPPASTGDARGRRLREMATTPGATADVSPRRVDPAASRRDNGTTSAGHTATMTDATVGTSAARIRPCARPGLRGRQGGRGAGHRWCIRSAGVNSRPTGTARRRRSATGLRRRRVAITKRESHRRVHPPLLTRCPGLQDAATPLDRRLTESGRALLAWTPDSTRQSTTPTVTVPPKTMQPTLDRCRALLPAAHPRRRCTQAG